MSATDIKTKIGEIVDLARANAAKVEENVSRSPVPVYRKIVSGKFVREYRVTATELQIVEPLAHPEPVSRADFIERLYAEDVSLEDLKTEPSVIYRELP